MEKKLALWLVVLFSLSGCFSRPPADVYNSRGSVIRAERAADGTGRVTLLHEAIADFKGRDGKVQGMAVMAMTFGAETHVPVEALEPRDKIAFRFEVHWNTPLPLRLIEVRELDPQTPLKLDGYELEAE